MERLRLQGGKPNAVTLGRFLTTQLPSSGKARRYLVRALLTEPVSVDDVVEARHNADIMLTLYDDAGVSRLFARVLIAQHRHSVTTPELVASAVTFGTSFPSRRQGPIRELLGYLLAAGDTETALRIAKALAVSAESGSFPELAHEFALRADRVDLALEIEQLLAADPESDIERVTNLEAARLISEGEPEAAVDLLAGLRPRRDRAYTEQLTKGLLATGRYEALLDYLTTTNHSLSPADEACLLFDCLWVLGKTQDAVAALHDAAPDEPGNLAIFTRLRDAHRTLDGTDDALLTLVRDAARDPQPTQKWVDDLASQYFELGLVDEVVALAADPHLGWRMGPIGIYTQARAHYVRREFDDALRKLDALPTTIRHWEGEKLRARILFERGDVEEALEHRETNRRPDEPLDEVTYHAWLYLDRLADAFPAYLDDADRARLTQVFGDRAEPGPDFDTVASRFVIAQGGPGDEIQLAGTYPELLRRSDALTVACEPRLESLMQRSFPAVEFLATPRLSSRRDAGILAPGTAPRSPTVLFDLLTEEAHKRAAECDRVMLGRALQQVSLLAEPPAPFPPYLTPIEDLRTEAAGRFGAATTIGVVWRSEFNDAMRSIHYLEVEELSSLLGLDADFVCLQHDATEAERDTLLRSTDGRVSFVDDIDLRDDFEATAGVVAACDHVVGIGTTMLELAAAVGTPTILLQPNRFGAWRSRTADGDDYWHQGVRVTTIDDPAERTRCVVRAAALLDP